MPNRHVAHSTLGGTLCVVDGSSELDPESNDIAVSELSFGNGECGTRARTASGGVSQPAAR